MDTEFNKLLRAEMAKRGLTQAQLSARSGIHRVNLTRRLTGVSAWKLSDMEQIATALGYGSLSEMLKEAGL